MTLKPKAYIGFMKNSNTIFFKGEHDFLNKTFNRIK